jgi:glycosyltransferase involved in cell wall biosynthesis
MVSVIIPNYNHEKYLVKRIDSVLLQTYKDIEVIILDDSSTDNSKSIIERYRDNSRISAIDYNETNSGSVFKQWKNGIFRAKGDYIWIAESDDFASTDFLEKIIPLLIRHNADLAFSDSMTIDEEGENIPGWKTLITVPKNDTHIVLEGNPYICKEMIKGNRINNASAAVFKREKALKIQNMEDYKLCGDWYFWINIMFDSKFIYFNEKLNYFRQHPKRFTSAANKNGLQYLEGLNVAGFVINRFQIPSLSINTLLIGGEYFYNIKKDNDLVSENIRSECIIKCLALFKYKKLCELLFYSKEYLRVLFRILKKAVGRYCIIV